MSLLKIGLTVGDINGIGLEVILKTLGDERICEFCTPIIYGSSKVVSYHKNIVKIKNLKVNSIQQIDQLKEGQVNVMNCWNENVRINLGKVAEEGGKYAYISLDRATNDLKNEHIDAIVTGPIHKHAMQLANFPHPGHTEYLSKQSTTKDSLMLLVNEDLRIGLATNHIPISQVALQLTKELVFNKIQLMHNTLRQDFAFDRPKIAVLGLNPHAGDGGSIGNEEKEIIIPAIEAAKRAGIMAIGPYPADGFFGAGTYNSFDGILAMYHDQGLVAFKALSFGAGVNFTAGLSFIRTSPDHGTAFNIVGKNVATEDSFRNALYLAIDVVKRRAEFKKMHADPLKPMSIDEIMNKHKDHRSSSEDDKNMEELDVTPTSKYQKAQQKEEEDDEEEQEDVLNELVEEAENDEELEQESEEETQREKEEVNEIIKKKINADEDGDGETL